MNEKDRILTQRRIRCRVTGILEYAEKKTMIHKITNYERDN